MAEENFTLKEMVREIRDDVKQLNLKIDRIDREGSIGTKADLVDHEDRLRILEKFQYKFGGAVAVVISLGALAAGLLH